jgi:hypothetical protein
LQKKHVGLRQYEYVSLEDISTWSGVPLDKIQKAVYGRTFVLVKSPENEMMTKLSKNSTIKISQFDNSLRLNVPLRVYVEPGDNINIKINYDARSFHPGTIEKMSRYLETLLQHMVKNPQALIRELKKKENHDEPFYRSKSKRDIESQCKI